MQEEDKVRLAAMTGLDPKQINQRKRHWKPSEDMRFALMEGVTGGGSSSGTRLYFDMGIIRPRLTPMTPVLASEEHTIYWANSVCTAVK